MATAAARILHMLLAAAGLLTLLQAAGTFHPPIHAQPGPRSPLPPLSYFALTASLEAPLRSGAQLSPEAWRTVERLAQVEARALEDLYDESERSIAAAGRMTGRPASQAGGRAVVAAMGYNRRVESILYITGRRLQETIGPAAHARLQAWMERRWPVEQELYGKVDGLLIGLLEPRWPVMGWTRKGKAPAQTRSASIFATRYDSKGAYTVALPDQCLKFANRGSHSCDDRGYIAGGDYSVIITYKNSLGVSVGEAGPWNIDDNFWASLSDPTPRRMFADLGVGMPEAQAAFYNGYNGGLDQYGRKVTAPFAIDLAFKVGDDLGLPKAKNDWVTVSFMWTADWGGANSGANSGANGGANGGAGGSAVITPIETAVAGADGSIVHEVQPGQSLWAIAVAYGTTVQALKDLNGLGESAVIVSGQKLDVKSPGPTWTPAPAGTQDQAGGATPSPGKADKKAEKAARKTAAAVAAGAIEASPAAAAALPPSGTATGVQPGAPASGGPDAGGPAPTKARTLGMQDSIPGVDPVLSGIVLFGLLGLALFLWGSRIRGKE